MHDILLLKVKEIDLIWWGSIISYKSYLTVLIFFSARDVSWICIFTGYINICLCYFIYPDVLL